MNWQVIYFNESVEFEAHQLEKSLKAKYVAIIDMMLEHGPNLGLPYTKALGKGLFEIRVKRHHGIARGLFCLQKNFIVILHVFIKKTNQIPKKELAIGRDRLKEVRTHGL